MKKLSQQHKNNIGIGLKNSVKVHRGENHYAWKDKKATEQKGYWAIHKWITRHYGTPKYCSNCHTEKSKKYEWANLSGCYKREKSDWARLCSKCHINFDKGNLILDI